MAEPKAGLQIDVQSKTWRAIEQWANENIERARTALEARGQLPEDTEFERGRIAALRDLLRLPEPPFRLPEGSSADLL